MHTHHADETASAVPPQALNNSGDGKDGVTLIVRLNDNVCIAAEHTALQRWIDRAAANGALHRNTAARKKAQAARLVAGR